MKDNDKEKYRKDFKKLKREFNREMSSRIDELTELKSEGVSKGFDVSLLSTRLDELNMMSSIINRTIDEHLEW